jgi:hypothetical protein
MKKLIALWLILFNAGCASYEAATEDRIMHEVDSTINRCRAIGKEIDEYAAKNLQDINPRSLYDTIPATLLITHKPPSFGHSIDGYCVYWEGICTGKHLRYWRKRWVVVGLDYTVWGCKRVNTRDK